ncbi:MAG: hypothetical protein K2Q18_02190 [Bdellovibrionales bacterium]|nr:hypothetical protein [Bdellovibrionales bacterium]
MFKKAIFVIALSLINSSLTYSSEWSDFDLEKMKDLVVTKKIKKIDDLFSIIPLEMKRNPILVYDSKALNADLVSLKTPRILMFNRDASLILSVSRQLDNNELSTRKDELEFISFDKKTGKFTVHVEQFNGEDQPFTGNGQKNAQVCLACHGNNPRPLFHDYNGWPGIYGSFGQNGVAVIGSNEHSGLVNFLKEYKTQPRYKDLDLSGFDEFPYVDKKDANGNIIAKKGSVGIGYKTQNFDGPFTELFEKAKFTPALAIGMEIETLMHKRLAKKLEEKSNFATAILPILYYLGDEGLAGSIESRCGHPNDKTKKVFEKISQLESGNSETLTWLISKIEANIKIDAEYRKGEVERNNILSPFVDARGIASIPYSAFFPTPINQSPDGDSFRKQMALVEVLFQRLGLDSTDISSSNVSPTTGIFHLSRLGKMGIDEKYFQNLFRGLRWAVSSEIQKLDSLSCEEIETKSIRSIETLFKGSPIQRNFSGILY